MEDIVAILLQWGLAGLLIASFTESFISPIIPDVLLIPLALANPSMAIWYALAATGISVLGGVVGYWIGAKLGVQAARKLIPAKYAAQIHAQVEQNSVWAIWLAAISPIPYKFVSITAGAFRVKWSVFLLASTFGRAKRFMLEGLLIYFFGEKAIALFNRYSDQVMMGSLIFVVLVVIAIYLYRRQRKSRKKMQEPEFLE